MLRLQFAVEIAANVDPVLVAAIYIALDEGFAHKGS